MSNDMTKYEYSKFMIAQYVHESPTSYMWFGTKPPLDKVVCSCELVRSLYFPLCV